MDMESESIMEILRKQKINDRSSTEANIVGADNALPQFLWSRYLIEGQGYAVEELEFHKDNISDMLMKTNDKYLSTKRTKHIQLRYLFIKDCIENGNLSLK